MAPEGRGLSAALGKLPRYNGSSSVARFLSQFKKRAALEDIAEDKKADILRFLLDGPAEVFLTSHPELERAGLQELENRLKEWLTPEMTSAEGLTRLMQVRQEDRLTEEYAERIEQEAAELIEFVPDLRTEGTREGLLIQAFINGLRQELKIQLSAQPFTKFRDAVTAAKKVEKVSQEILHVNAVIKRQDNHTGKKRRPRVLHHGAGSTPTGIRYGIRRRTILRPCTSHRLQPRTAAISAPMGHATTPASLESALRGAL